MSDTTTDTTTADKAGDSTATDAATKTAATQTDTSATDTAAGKDWQAEAEKWKTFARKHEDASKANADKAKRFDEFEESQKTEQQKLADKLAAAEKRATELEAGKVRSDVAADKGVPASLLSGATKEELEASADALLAFRGEKPKPDFGGGDRGADIAGAKQLSETDVNRLYSERKYDEIEAARLDGRLNTYLGA